MQVLLCDGFEMDSEGVIACSGESRIISLEEVQGLPASSGVTLEQLDALIVAAALVFAIAYTFGLIQRQLR